MKERPILMSAPMVQAILAGEKTQTRRIVKVQPKGDFWQARFDYNGLIFKTEGLNPGSMFPNKYIKCPYGEIGDRLWVRESFYQAGHWEEYPRYSLGGALAKPKKKWKGSHTIWYIDEEGNKTVRVGSIVRKVPSIHMPRWSSRITLEITNIRVEKLQDISEADAWAEGCEGFDDDVTGGQSGYGEYAELWEKINGKGSWADNPFVWVIEFKRV